MEDEKQRATAEQFKERYEPLPHNEPARVDDYPYGFKKRCVLFVTIEDTGAKQRIKRQTEFKGVLNKPKFGTYTNGVYLLKERETGRLKLAWHIDRSKPSYYSVADLNGNNPIDYGEAEQITEHLNEVMGKDYTKAQRVHGAMEEAISKAYDKAKKEHTDKFAGKSHDDLREHILNHANWRKVDGGGYYMKDGYGKTYNGYVMVCLGCDFINHTFTTEIKGRRLTPYLKNEALEVAQRQLKAWLPTIKNKIEIKDRPDSYPEITIRRPEGDKLQGGCMLYESESFI